jgi:tetratricopeptide (TPR) repeat protein
MAIGQVVAVQRHDTIGRILRKSSTASTIRAPRGLTMARIDYSQVCFVIMPFGTKKVGDKDVDFDFIFKHVFEPAVNATPLGEAGGPSLVAKRTDQDFFAGDISQEMFEYLEYSRFALADISGLNPNVFYELGVRHRAHDAGTAVFRQVGLPIPFDINTIKAFDYEYQPVENAAKSRELITRVLTDSLQYNRLDSPVQRALLAQRARAATQAGSSLDDLLREAENAIRSQRWEDAIKAYRQATLVDPGNCSLRLRLGLFLKDRGRWDEALAEFDAAVKAEKDYADGWREKGIAENKLYIKRERPAGAATGEESLRQAVTLNAADYDGWASLGGVIKRQADDLDKTGHPDQAVAEYKRAYDIYRKATDVSEGNSYPLLNEMKLAGRIDGKVPNDIRIKLRLPKAERFLKAQVADQPPSNAPWSFFDLSEVKLYSGDAEGFINVLTDGLTYCTDYWQPETHLNSLLLLKAGGVSLPGLDDGIALLREATAELKKSAEART